MPNFPTRRCTAYEDIGLQRWEGAALCKAMNWGLREPLSPDQIKTLEYLAQHLAEWKSRKLSLRSFINKYLEELKKDAHQENTPTTSGKSHRS